MACSRARAQATTLQLEPLLLHQEHQLEHVASG
jgi:hypothetical protein